MFTNSSEKKILNIIQYSPPIFIVITSLFIMALLYYEHRTILKSELSKVEDEFILTKKNEIKNQVKMVEKFILNSKDEKSSNIDINSLQNKIINEIKKFEYQKDRYIFIIDYDSKVLVHANKKLLNKKIFEFSKVQKRKNEIKDIISLAKSGGGYLTYTQFRKPSTNEFVIKTSYVVGLNDWRWFIGTGFYHDDVNDAINLKRESLERNYKQQLKQAILITISSFLVMLILSFYFSKAVRNRFTEYKEEKEEYTRLLNQQSKMASIGEMLGNIAHQWRQPLTVISMSSNNMKMDIALDEVDIKIFEENIAEIDSQVEYLSHTIDDFRNFFKQDNNISTFNLKNAIEKIHHLIKVQFKFHEIEIYSNVNDVTIKGIYNEFLQVLINILNNSKDAFINKKSHDKRYVFIDVQVKDTILITIKDNAGGIEESVIDKIYEPYITTKHQSQGTGIGLYMSKEIITKHMNGNISSKNIEYEYMGEFYKGTLTTIDLPIVTE